jgi:putative addiction module killer protein
MFDVPMKLTIREYTDDAGRSPFRVWLETLDVHARARVQARILRFEFGNLGDHKSVGPGVCEARLAFGPGYRVYFGRHGRSIILLLLGGDKSSQSADIRKARRYWDDYMKAVTHGTKK